MDLGAGDRADGERPGGERRRAVDRVGDAAGEYGIDGVSLSVPVSLGTGGLQEIVQWPLSAEERAGLHTAAGIVADAAQTLG